MSRGKKRAISALAGNVLLEAGEGGLPKVSVVNVPQIFTVDKKDLDRYCGSLSQEKINQILYGINLLLQPAETDS